MSLKDRIYRHNEEGAHLNDLLEPILHKVMSVEMPIEFAKSWDLKSFDVGVTTEDLLLTARDMRDGETKVYKVPFWAAEGDMDAWVAMLKELSEEKKAGTSRNAKILEIERLRRRVAQLEGELK